MSFASVVVRGQLIVFAARPRRIALKGDRAARSPRLRAVRTIVDPLQTLDRDEAQHLADLLARHRSLSAATAASKLYRAVLKQKPPVALDRAELTAVLLTLNEHPDLGGAGTGFADLQVLLRTALGHTAVHRGVDAVRAVR